MNKDNLVQIIYKKETGFITIESELIAEDQNYIYMSCGKYLKKNIIRAKEVRNKKSELEDLKDDA